MRVLVTGASGFLGRAVVAQAVAAGHDVLAMVRPAGKADQGSWPEGRVTLVRCDLRQRGPWCDSVKTAEAVIHLAASLSGDLPTQFAGTVIATENLLAELDFARLKRFVHVSSFSVYDYASVPAFGRLTEATPIERNPNRRGEYTITKIVQERLVRETCAEKDAEVVVVRPGAVYGPTKDWLFGAGLSLGRLNLIFSSGARFPVTYVDNCANALVKAVTAPAAAGEVINVIDDELPTYGQFFRASRRAGAKVGPGLPVPWFVLGGGGKVIDLVNRYALGGRAKLPEIMSYPRQQARWRPLRFSNAKAKELLGWTPAVSFRDAIEKTVAGAA
jgi:nucleoside-diphosphate-sugar epimerase